MTIRQTTCFIAVCSDCGTEHEHDYTPHWPTAGDAVDDAVNSEWWGDETLLLCCACKTKPHPFAPGDELNVGFCGRCDQPIDEHAEAVGGAPC